MRRIILRILGAIVLAIVLTIGMGTPVLAAEPEPTTVSLDGIVIFQD